ncbi:MAG: DDE-type integrase/transposase/recombinase [Erysipelotrichaceae bacterium]|nr:DDE-type integrase/transposase/recombinase [Erysipelotrichaceae bacterium]
MTYLIFGNRRAYLSSIIDLYDKRIVSYVISRHNSNKLVMDTLNEALAKRKDVQGCILHSDQGFQYTSNLCRQRDHHLNYMGSTSFHDCLFFSL